MAVEEVLSVRFKGDAGGLESAAGKAAQALSKVNKSGGDATQSLVNLSRIAQDAPYGFIGISNNLNPLLESFQRLQKESGGTGAAIKAMVAGISGPAGLGLTVGAVSSLLVAFGGELFDTGKAAEGTKGNLSDLQNELQGIADSLGGQASKVTTLFTALTSGQLNIDQRKEALKELKSVNEMYFGQLKEENGVVSGLVGAYQNYLASLEAVGRSKAIESQISKLFSKKLELELQIDPKYQTAANPEMQKLIGKQRKQLEQALADAGGPVDVTKEAFDPNDKKMQRRIQLQDQLNRLIAGQNVLIDDQGARAELRNIQMQIDGLTKLYEVYGKFGDIKASAGSGTEQRSQFNFFDKFFDVDPKTADAKAKKALEMYHTAIEYATKNNTTFKGLDAVLKAPGQEATIAEAQKWWANFQKGIFELNFKTPVNFSMIPPEQPKEDAERYHKAFIETMKELNERGTDSVLMLPKDPKALEKQLEDMMKRAQRAGLGKSSAIRLFAKGEGGEKELEKMIQNMEQLSALVSGSLQPALEGAFSELLKGGNFMEGLLTGLGKTLEQLVVKLASAAALAGIVSLLTPGSNFGSLFSKFSGIPGFAEGGAVGGATMALVGENNLTSRANPEVIIPAHKIGKMMGGGNFPDYIPVLSGDQLLLMNKRASRRQGRTF